MYSSLVSAAVALAAFTSAAPAPQSGGLGGLLGGGGGGKTVDPKVPGIPAPGFGPGGTGACSSGATPKENHHLINFDDLQKEPNVPPVENLRPGYNDLYFRSFNVLHPQDSVSFTVPESLPQFLGSNPFSRGTYGTPAITAQFNNSKTADFDLNSFAYSCVLTIPEPVWNFIIPCDIAITGVKGPGNSTSEVCNHVFEYNVPSTFGLWHQQNTGPINDCQGISTVDLQVTAKPPYESLTPYMVIQLDDVDVNTYTC